MGLICKIFGHKVKWKEEKRFMEETNLRRWENDQGKTID